MHTSETKPGQPYPLGATCESGGVNFSVFSKSGLRVELLFFDDVADGRPARIIVLDPQRNHTFHYWHIFVPDVRPGQLYGFRVAGPNDPQHGQRFDGEKLLIDPYGRAVAVPRNYDRAAASRPGDNAAMAIIQLVGALNDVVSEEDEALAVDVAEAMEGAEELANNILKFFGYNDTIIDNILQPEERNMFYMMEDWGILRTEREDTTLYDGREWRINYWYFQRKIFNDMMQKTQQKDEEERFYEEFFKNDEMAAEIWDRRGDISSGFLFE